MEIEFERKGGFAGIHLNTTIDTANLTPEERNKIHSLVVESNFFGLNSTADTSHVRGHIDSFKYKITIKEGNKINTLEGSDVTMNPIIRPLLNYIEKKAIENKKQEK
jgi:hypothetical protein